MRGILGWGVHLPYRRLDRAGIAAIAGAGGGKGTRAAAGYDEDTTTMAVEATRNALRDLPKGTAEQVRALWFATTAPAYQDRTNAAAIHAATRLLRATPAYDLTGAVRSAVAALDAALASPGTHLVATADLRVGRPGSADETAGGDAAATLVIGGAPDTGTAPQNSEEHPPLLATLAARAAATEEFLDRWRTPGDQTAKTWEERFGETRYTALGLEAWHALLVAAGIEAADVDLLVVCGTHDRAVAAVTKKTGVTPDRVLDRLAATIGNPGAAQPALLLAAALEQAAPRQRIALLVLADGADAFLWQTTDALATHRPSRSVADQITLGAPVAYGRYLAWRGLLPVEPPRRPEPARVSASAASRATGWKFGLVAPAAVDDAATNQGPVPTQDSVATHDRVPTADAPGTIATFTVDRLAHSPSPPVIFAVVDFATGDRLPMELTDVDPGEPAIGGRVEATFRRLSTADGIHNYFWKARPLRTPAAGEEGR